MVAMLAEALIVGYIPGAVLFRLPDAQSTMRAALAFDERLFWAVLLSGTWSLLVVLGLAAIGRYTFTALVAVNGAIGSPVSSRGHSSLSVACRPPALAFDRARCDRRPRRVARSCQPLNTLSVAGIRVRISTKGFKLAQRGQLVVSDPTVAAVPPEFRDLFFPSHDNPTYCGLRFVGYYVRNPDTGAVIGQFPQLIRRRSRSGRHGTA